MRSRRVRPCSGNLAPLSSHVARVKFMSSMSPQLIETPPARHQYIPLTTPYFSPLRIFENRKVMILGRLSHVTTISIQFVSIGRPNWSNTKPSLAQFNNGTGLIRRIPIDFFYHP